MHQWTSDMKQDKTDKIFNEMKKVQFNNDVYTLLVPHEYRKCKWIYCAIVRAHFKLILLPILNKIINSSNFN